MGKRNVFGYFQTMEQAKKAAEALQAQGYEQVFVDRISPMLGGNPYDLDDEIHSLFRRPGSSLATTTLGSPSLSDDQRILAATHVDAHGQSGGTGFQHPEDVCVTVITDENGYKAATALLEEYGAKD